MLQAALDEQKSECWSPPRQFCEGKGRSLFQLSAVALGLMAACHWPGPATIIIPKQSIHNQTQHGAITNHPHAVLDRSYRRCHAPRSRTYLLFPDHPPRSLPEVVDVCLLSCSRRVLHAGWIPDSVWLSAQAVLQTPQPFLIFSTIVSRLPPRPVRPFISLADTFCFGQADSKPQLGLRQPLRQPSSGTRNKESPGVRTGQSGVKLAFFSHEHFWRIGSPSGRHVRQSTLRL